MVLLPRLDATSGSNSAATTPLPDRASLTVAPDRAHMRQHLLIRYSDDGPWRYRSTEAPGDHDRLDSGQPDWRIGAGPDGMG